MSFQMRKRTSLLYSQIKTGMERSLWRSLNSIFFSSPFFGSLVQLNFFYLFFLVSRSIQEIYLSNFNPEIDEETTTILLEENDNGHLEAVFLLLSFFPSQIKVITMLHRQRRKSTQKNCSSYLRSVEKDPLVMCTKREILQ